MSTNEPQLYQSDDCTDLTTTESPRHFFRNKRGYEFISGEYADEVASHSRLLAVAEYGFEAATNADHVHHELPAKVNLREAVTPADADEHARRHASGTGYRFASDVLRRWGSDGG